MVTGDGTRTAPVSDLSVGDLVLVRPGGRVPADGVVTDGSAELDESMITGESRPVPKGPGDRVAGTVVTDTAIRVRVDAVGEQTALAGIRRLVSQAQASRSRTQALADRAAALLFWFALGAGLVTVVVWLALGQPDQAVERTVTVLVIACPHALGLAIPLVITISTALAARNGILVKDRLALERMRTVDAVLFDKTDTHAEGTVTPPARHVPGSGLHDAELFGQAAGVRALEGVGVAPQTVGDDTEQRPRVDAPGGSPVGTGGTSRSRKPLSSRSSLAATVSATGTSARSGRSRRLGPPGRAGPVGRIAAHCSTGWSCLAKPCSCRGFYPSLAGAGAPSPGGCRCAKGGTPNPLTSGSSGPARGPGMRPRLGLRGAIRTTA